MGCYDVLKILVKHIRFYNMNILIKFINWLSNTSFHNSSKNLFGFEIKIIGLK